LNNQLKNSLPKPIRKHCSKNSSLNPISHNHLQFLLALTNNPAASHALPSRTLLSVGSTQLYGITQLPSPTTAYTQLPSPTTAYTRTYQSFGPSGGPYQSFGPSANPSSNECFF